MCLDVLADQVQRVVATLGKPHAAPDVRTVGSDLHPQHAAAEQLFDEWAEKYEPLWPEELIELHTKLYGSEYTDALALVQSGKLR